MTAVLAHQPAFLAAYWLSRWWHTRRNCPPPPPPGATWAGSPTYLVEFTPGRTTP